MKSEKVNECRFIKANGIKCQSPALRGFPFCYFHSRSRYPAPRRKPTADQPIELPHLENSADIGPALAEIFQALASSRISTKRAGMLLYNLQLVSSSAFGSRSSAPDPASVMTLQGARKLVAPPSDNRADGRRASGNGTTKSPGRSAGAD
jgi:hypothetical protein